MREALQNLYNAYVDLLELGRNRIIDLGGTCDSVDVMEDGDPALAAARAALSTKQEGDEASRDAATMEWASRAAAEVKAAGPQPTRPVSEFIAEQRTGWRTIDSAPKDGTSVLLRCQQRHAIGYAFEPLVGWYSEETDDLLIPDPVGWMPLPPPLAAPAIAAIVETYTDILSPETARKVASRIRAIPEQPASPKGWLGRGINDPDSGA